MDTATLATAMGCSRAVADRYLVAFNAAMIAAGCVTRNRAAMWCAQLGHESAGLRYMEEIASGAAYEGRASLGNTQPGDGRRFKGRGPIQVTGRANYAAVSKWAHAKGYVPTPTYFLDRPAELASDRYGFLGPVWYWTVARPTINARCDEGAVTAVTKLINGGTNGLADRVARWERCLRLGNALLPTTASVTTRVPTSTAAVKPTAVPPHVLQEP
jgi:predicted chitinase